MALEDNNTVVTLSGTTETVVVADPRTLAAQSSVSIAVVLEDTSTVVAVVEEVASIVATGAQGPQGIEGPEGPIGLQGPMGPQGIQGPTGTYEDEPVYSKRVDFINEYDLYKGEAAIGSSENSALWRIRKITMSPIDGDVAEVWASGDALFDKIWADRATYIYS